MLDVLPCFFAPHFTDSRETYSVDATKFRTGQRTAADFQNFGFCEFRVVVGLSEAGLQELESSLRNALGDILSVRSVTQVCGIETPPIVARMQNLQSLRTRAVSPLGDYLMSTEDSLGSCATSDGAVASGLLCSKPSPTFVRFADGDL